MEQWNKRQNRKTLWDHRSVVASLPFGNVPPSPARRPTRTSARQPPPAAAEEPSSAPNASPSTPPRRPGWPRWPPAWRPVRPPWIKMIDCEAIWRRQPCEDWVSCGTDCCLRTYRSPHVADFQTRVWIGREIWWLEHTCWSISGGVNTWIGLNDIGQEGTFTWSDDSALGSYTNWNGGEPDSTAAAPAIQVRVL